MRLVQGSARLVQREHGALLGDVPILAGFAAEGVLEPDKLPLLFEIDLQLREIEIVRVPQAPQEQPIHDLAEHLIARPDAAVGGYVEDHRVGGDVLVDRLEDDRQLRIARP